ncbi:MAG: hypothetical protein R3Y29_01705, partial [bacterium]
MRNKSKKINLLLDTIQDVEYKISEVLEACEDSNLNNLNQLLKHFLYIDDGNSLRFELRKEFEAGIVPLTGSSGLRKKLAMVDLEFFGRAYFPHYFSRKSPAFHTELDAI